MTSSWDCEVRGGFVKGMMTTHLETGGRVPECGRGREGKREEEGVQRLCCG
jgi:hypothetical protein